MHGVAEIDPAQLETLHNEGLQIPYVELGQVEPAIKLVMEEREYWYYRTLPLKGYSAALGRYLRQLREEDEDRRVILARFWSRIYIYATGVTPIGAGKPPGG